MNRACLCLAALVAGCLMSPAADFDFKPGGLSLWLPDDWNVDIDEVSLLAFPAKSHALLALITIPGAPDLNAAFKQYPGILSAKFSAYKETQYPRRFSYNGMSALLSGGAGRHEKRNEYIRVIVFQAPHGFIMLTWAAEPTELNHYKAIYDRIEYSIKPAR